MVAAPDTWLDVATGIGAILGGSAVVVGGTLAFLFGRRASVNVSAEVHETDRGFVISTKPGVKAVGIFRVSFGETVDQGIIVRLSEVYVDDDDELREARYWEKNGFFEQQYVDPGEELTTSVIFSPIESPSSVIGWQAYLRITAPTRFGRFRTSWWADQVFVARPRGVIN